MVLTISLSWLFVTIIKKIIEKKSKLKEINIDFSKSVYENASNVYNDFKDRFILN